MKLVLKILLLILILVCNVHAGELETIFEVIGVEHQEDAKRCPRAYPIPDCMPDEGFVTAEKGAWVKEKVECRPFLAGRVSEWRGDFFLAQRSCC